MRLGVALASSRPDGTPLTGEGLMTEARVVEDPTRYALTGVVRPGKLAPVVTRSPIRYPELRTRRWTRAEYDRLIALGVLDEDEPIELLAGEMVVREPQAGPHATAVQLVQIALQRAFSRGWSIRGIADYWNLNLRDGVLEVYRQPARTARAHHGWRARVPVANLLP